MPKQPLLLISRYDLRDAAAGAAGERLIRKLARLTRQGYHLLSVASQPDDWSSSVAVSRRSQPETKSIRQRVSEAGGHFDGVYYIPRSVLTQKKNRLDSLRDIMIRFGAEPADVYLLSSGKKLLRAAESLGINPIMLSRKTPLDERLSDFISKA